MATRSSDKNRGLLIVLLMVAVVLLAVAPLVLVSGSEFSGADGQAEQAIQEVQPDVKPWFAPLITLPGGETETLLFCVQAALGAGVIGYYFGLKRGERQAREKEKVEPAAPVTSNC